MIELDATPDSIALKLRRIQMIDALATRAAENAISVLTKTLGGSENVLPPSLFEKYFATRSPETVFKAYFSYCHAKCGSIRILGMVEPVNLTAVYTRVRVQQRPPQHSDQFKSDGATATRSAVDFACCHDRFFLLGGPGSGKSTFLKFLLLESLTGRFVYNFIPFYIPLAELEAKGLNIRSFCINTLASCGISHPVGMFHEFSTKGAFSFLIDGLDEIRATTLVHIINEIDDLSASYSGSRFIVSCRYAAYKGWLSNFSMTEIEEFSKREIILFIRKWSKALDKDPRPLVNTILSNTRLFKMARVPIILSIVCISYSSSLEATSNRGELYREAIEVLLNKWDASRNLKRETRYERLTFRMRERLLQHLATVCFCRGDVYFSYAKAGAIISAFFSTIEHIMGGQAVDTEHILGEIELHHGLLRQTSANTWMFSHLTIQEYFVASYIASSSPDVQRALIKNYLTDPTWREVIILTCSLLPNCDAMILNILEVLSSFGVTTKAFLKIRNRTTSVNDQIFEDPAELIRMGAHSTPDEAARAQAGHLALVHVSNPEVVGWGRDTIKKYRQIITETLMGRDSWEFCLSEIIDGPVRFLLHEVLSELTQSADRLSVDRSTSRETAEVIQAFRLPDEESLLLLLKRVFLGRRGRTQERAADVDWFFLKRELETAGIWPEDMAQRENITGLKFLFDVITTAGLRELAGVRFIHVTRENRDLIKDRVLGRCGDNFRELVNMLFAMSCRSEVGYELAMQVMQNVKKERIAQLFAKFLSMLVDIQVGMFERVDNSYRLLLAAEVLSEILESDIVVSPHIRGAAIDTLAKLTIDFQGPPEDPAGEGCIRLTA